MTKSSLSGKFFEKNNMVSNDTILSDSARNDKKNSGGGGGFSSNGIAAAISLKDKNYRDKHCPSKKRFS